MPEIHLRHSFTALLFLFFPPLRSSHAMPGTKTTTVEAPTKEIATLVQHERHEDEREGKGERREASGMKETPKFIADFIGFSRFM